MLQRKCPYGKSMTGVLQRFNAQAITSTVLSQHALTAIEANVRASE
jgi:hypothetical protein